jgi:hypothetical protein
LEISATQPTIPLLNYAAPATGESARRRRTPMQVALFLLALPAVVTPFVPFAYDSSPVDAVRDVPQFGSDDWILYLVALTFFTGFPILLWKSRLLLLPVAPRWWEWRVLAVVTLIISIPIVIVVGGMLWQVRRGNFSFDSEGMLMLSVALGVPPAATTVMALRWRRRGWQAALETLLISGYLTNAAMCLLAFHEYAEIGYWLTVTVAASFAAEMILPQPQNL